MMTLLEAIRGILNHELIHDGSLELVEADRRSRCQSVRLNKIGPAVALKLDQPEDSGSVNQRMFPLFNPNEPGITRVCDYIVFYEAPRMRVPAPTGRQQTPQDQRMFVFLCELKSTRPMAGLEQIRNSRLISEFIVNMARHHRRVVRKTAVEYRGLVFSTEVPPPKGVTRPGAPPYQPDKVMPDLQGAFYPCGITLRLESLCA